MLSSQERRNLPPYDPQLLRGNLHAPMSLMRPASIFAVFQSHRPVCAMHHRADDGGQARQHRDIVVAVYDRGAGVLAGMEVPHQWVSPQLSLRRRGSSLISGRLASMEVCCLLLFFVSPLCMQYLALCHGWLLSVRMPLFPILNAV